MDQKSFMMEDYDQNRDAIVEEEAIPLSEIGNHVRSQEFSSNAEIINATPLMTMDIPAVDVMDLLNGTLNGRDLRNTLAGMALMVNRLIFENKYLLRELQSLKSSGVSGMGRFDSLVFKKTNINTRHEFQGGEGIPPCCLNDLVEVFDQNCARRGEPATNTLRRFVKFLLENIIPRHSHQKFTVRERGGYERLLELPADLSAMIKDICLESVNLLDVRTEDDREKREELRESLFKYMKFALQELRRTPRKAKIAVRRDPLRND